MYGVSLRRSNVSLSDLPRGIQLHCFDLQLRHVVINVWAFYRDSLSVEIPHAFLEVEPSLFTCSFIWALMLRF